MLPPLGVYFANTAYHYDGKASAGSWWAAISSSA